MLSDEEIAEQWEYKVSDPHTPQVIEAIDETKEESEKE